jgi:rfaE bifunctional protein nucleotidyltransferase chain/domain
MRASPAPIYADIDAMVERTDLAALGRVVLANGCFDPLHVGHARYLEGAKRHGDFLVVALNNDASTRSLKGEGRPIMPGGDRAALVAALAVVDAVVLFGDPSVEAILERLRPAVHAKGTDYTVETVPERNQAKRLGIETVIVGDPKAHASSAVVETIRQRGGR